MENSNRSLAYLDCNRCRWGVNKCYHLGRLLNLAAAIKSTALPVGQNHKLARDQNTRGVFLVPDWLLVDFLQNLAMRSNFNVPSNSLVANSPFLQPSKLSSWPCCSPRPPPARVAVEAEVEAAVVEEAVEVVEEAVVEAAEAEVSVQIKKLL